MILKKLINKYSSVHRETKATFWYTICNILQKGVSFITLPIFTRLLTVSDIGVCNLYNSWAAIFSVFVTLYLPYGVFSVAMQKYKNDRTVYISSMQIILLSWGCFVLLLTLIFNETLVSITGLTQGLLLLMILQMVFSSIVEMWMARKRFEYSYKMTVLVAILVSIFAPVTSMILILFMEEKAFARLLGIAVVNSIIGLIICSKTFFETTEICNLKYVKYAISFNFVLIPYYLSQMLFNQSDIVMISKIVGIREAGIYGLAYTCSMAFSIFINAINNSFTPWLYGKIENNDANVIKNISNKLLIFYFVFIVLFILVGPEIIYLLATTDYYEAIWVMSPIIASLFFLVVTQLYNSVLFYYEKKICLIWGTVGAAVVNIILNYLLIPVFGYIVAGYTTLISYIAFAWGNYWFYDRQLVRNGKVEIYDNKFILTLSVLFLVLVMFVTFFYDSAYYRFSILVLLLMSGYLKRDLIIDFVTLIRTKE